MRCFIGQLFTLGIFANTVMKVWTTVEPEVPSIVISYLRDNRPPPSLSLSNDQLPAAFILDPPA